MSSLKRKDAPGGTSSAKASKNNADSRPSKRTKADKTSINNKSDAKLASKPPTAASQPKSVTLPTVSKLKEEEPLFPRGGGSVLSPLEQKQISIQAKQDVLFEQESGKGAKKADRASKKKKHKSAKDVKLGKTHQEEEDGVRIESLNYKVRSNCLIYSV